MKSFTDSCILCLTGDKVVHVKIVVPLIDDEFYHHHHQDSLHESEIRRSNGGVC